MRLPVTPVAVLRSLLVLMSGSGVPWASCPFRPTPGVGRVALSRTPALVCSGWLGAPTADFGEIGLPRHRRRTQPSSHATTAPGGRKLPAEDTALSHEHADYL